MLDECVQKLRQLGLSETTIGDELFWRGYELGECQNDEQRVGWQCAKVKERWLLAYDPALMTEE